MSLDILSEVCKECGREFMIGWDTICDGMDVYCPYCGVLNRWCSLCDLDGTDKDCSACDAEQSERYKNKCKYCGANTDSVDPNVLCSGCRATFGHSFYSEL